MIDLATDFYRKAHPDEKGTERASDTVSHLNKYATIARPIPMKRELKGKQLSTA